VCPSFRFLLIDGAHTWEVDGHAFFLCEKLLKPSEWILFDDLHWTIADSEEAQKNVAGKPPIPMELRKTEQIIKVFRLLVKLSVQTLKPFPSQESRGRTDMSNATPV
jgi:hypothetical protein